MLWLEAREAVHQAQIDRARCQGEENAWGIRMADQEVAIWFFGWNVQMARWLFQGGHYSTYEDISLPFLY